MSHHPYAEVRAERRRERQRAYSRRHRDDLRRRGAPDLDDVRRALVDVVLTRADLSAVSGEVVARLSARGYDEAETRARVARVLGGMP